MRKSAQLCWDCKKCTGGCSWSKNFEPVNGWVATPTRVKTATKNNKIYSVSSYKIKNCPLFERG